jgi:hypothetical protein
VCGVSSVGDAGAVDRAASGARVAGCFTCSPSPRALVAFMLRESRPRMWTGVCRVRKTRKWRGLKYEVSYRVRCGSYVVSFS